MLAIKQDGTEVNTRDFVQDHSDCYDSYNKYYAGQALKTGSFAHFLFQDANPFGLKGPVRIENLSYLRKVIKKIRSEQPLYREEDLLG
jgi:hypothetical protein